MRPYALVERLGAVSALDRAAGPLAAAAKRLIGRGVLKDVLSGTPLGHPLHPVLSDVPIGAFTSAAVLDLFATGDGNEPAASILIATGVLSAVPTAAAGYADWSETYGEAQRIGLVHAALNAGGVALYAGSLLARLRGDRRAGMLLALSGLAAVGASGYLGGHLSFGHGVGVNNAFLQRGPDEWTEVLPADDLEAGTPRRADVGDATVLLVRRGEEILAIGSRCTHAGGPLEEGTMDPREGTVQCPWHQSVFRLDDGSAVHGPASVPEHAYDVRVRNGVIELRRRATA
jgi:nitrite reductase/ring-hydroxylating ferredoxin subunit/uncharacterized membrane protein